MDPGTIVEMFRARVAKSGDRVALRYKEGGAWKVSAP